MPTTRSPGPLHLIQGSFSPKKVARQYPLLAGMHRATDGALLGVLIAVLMMSGFSFHWRYLWTVAYTELETTRDLTQKLKYSTAMLEQHLLKRASLPLSMVRTNAKKLHYLDNPDALSSPNNDHDSHKNRLIKRFASHSVNYGY